MKTRMFVAPIVGLLLTTSALAVDNGIKAWGKSDRTGRSRTATAAARLRCTLTGSEVTSCCCVQRDGKLYCTLAKKSVETCCCEPAVRGGERDRSDRQG